MKIPPVAKKKPREFEIHDVTFKDDYFWLRNKKTEEVISYLNDENAYTTEMMKHTEELQELLFQEMKNRIKETDESTPIKVGEYYYFFQTEEGKNYRIHCRKHESLDAPEEVILDENLLAEGQKYMRIGSMKISPNHKMLAYSVDFTGGETFAIRIFDLEKREIIDSISNVGYQIEWDKNNDAIFYSELDDIHREYAISRHVIGADQSDDMRIIEEADTTFMVFLKKSNDQQYIFILIAAFAAETVDVRYLDLDDETRELMEFYPRTTGIEFRIEHHEGFFYFLTNIDDPQTFSLMKTRISEIDRKSWELAIDHKVEGRFPQLIAFQNHLVIVGRKEGYVSLTVFEPSTGATHDIDLPESIYGLQLTIDNWTDIFYFGNSEYATEEFRFIFSTPITPTSFYDYNLSNRHLELKKVDEAKGLDSSEFVNERRYATANDGTRIPISVTYKKDVELDGSNSLLLYGYGSYGASPDPIFDSKRLSLLDRGIIFAIAHIRGGGEEGKSWYHHGKLAHKMNTFTDFITCAEYLIAENFTSKDKLAIWGMSAGGLLIGAVVNMRPDLFGCAVAAVPFVDVINTMLDDTIPVTTYEYTEWGNPKIEAQFEWMREYSPYDNVEEKEYPPMLITAAYNDPRVQYWEPAKWTAKLRALKTDYNLLLLKTKMGSGHGGSSGRYDLMKEFAFIYSFIIDTLNVGLS
jgi:oligopeptidase B